MRQDNNLRSIDGIRPNRGFKSKNSRPRIRNPKIISANQNSYSSFNNPESINKPDNGTKKAKRPFKKRLKRYFLWILILIILAAGGYFYSLARTASKVFHGNVYSVIGSLFSNTKLNGESTGRVNILLAGYQGTVSNEGALTDSIMIVSINTKNNTAFTLSIPRDFYLNIPGVGDNRINAANDNSNFKQSGYFNGGIGQLQKTIEQDFNIPINYYALINYNAFEQAVNAVGGITVNIQSSDPRGLYDPNVDKAHGGPLNLPNGIVHLNGLSALALALARGDSPYSYGFPLSDINRTQHQRQMLIALEQKALSTGVLTNPITISKLFNVVGDNVSTNLTLPDVIRLAKLAHSVNLSNISSYGFSYGGTNPLLKTYDVTMQGQVQSVLIPQAGLDNFSQIRHYYLQISSTNPVIKENASVVILNGSGIANLAKTEEATLNAAGLNTTYIGSASAQYNNSMLIDLSKGTKPATLAYLKSIMPKGSITTQTTTGSVEANEGSGYSADFILIEGTNW